MSGPAGAEDGSPFFTKVLVTHFEARLFLKQEPGRFTTPGVREKRGARRGGARIRCPRCGWQPRKQDRWMCVCLHVWNTFQTRGICPGCGREWSQTQCLSCQQWSPHEDWYVEEDDDGDIPRS
jgi:hypothetical protein